MTRRRRIVVAAVVGILGLFNVLRLPRFETYHTVDVLQLVAAGMCFGVALATMFRGLERGE
jgi:ABC-type nickel/cobalt efflux system permease component RcnA